MQCSKLKHKTKDETWDIGEMKSENWLILFSSVMILALVWALINKKCSQRASNTLCENVYEESKAQNMAKKICLFSCEDFVD